MSRADSITPFLQQAVREGVFPGAVLFVRSHGEVVYHHAVGHMGHPPYDRPALTETIYDLASLTKPLATTTAYCRNTIRRRVGVIGGIDVSPILAILLIMFLQYAVVETIRDIGMRMN